MEDEQQERSDRRATEVQPWQKPSRRAFVAAAAGACGVAFWALHRSPLRAVEANPGAGTPGPVTLVKFSPKGDVLGKVAVPRVIKTEAQWKQQLSPISYEVTREAGTEAAYSGNTWDEHGNGLFRCICCDNALFRSNTKFDSGTGWPSFWQPIAKENVVEIHDTSFGMERVAISCRECDAHLGHVFNDGPKPTGLRYCMNSAAMRFVKFA